MENIFEEDGEYVTITYYVNETVDLIDDRIFEDGQSFKKPVQIDTVNDILSKALIFMETRGGKEISADDIHSSMKLCGYKLIR